MSTTDTFGFGVPCQVGDDCIGPTTLRVTTAADTRHCCPNHTPRLVAELLDATGSEEGTCVGCGEAAADVLAVATLDWEGALCRPHLVALLALALEPAAFRRIVEDAGGEAEEVFLLHGDYYTPDGQALQPTVVGAESARTLLAAIDDLDPYLDEELTGEVADTYETLVTLVRRGWAQRVGTDLDEGVARAMADQLIVHEAVGRDLGRPSITSEDRREMAGRIRRLVAEHDPQGRAAVGHERSPYRGEARWLAERLHADDSLRDVRRKVLLCFSGEERSALTRAFSDTLGGEPLTSLEGVYETIARTLHDRVVGELAQRERDRGGGRR